MTVFWFVMGVITGVLTLMTIQVLQAQRQRHWMEVPLGPFVPKEPEPQEWNTKELDEVFIPTPHLYIPKAVPALEECPQCGKAYRRVSQHIRLSHKTTTPPSA